MKRVLLLTLMIIAIMSICAISVSAATTSEFGDVETVPGIDLTGMNTEADKRIVIVDANGEYHTYPVNYFVSNDTTYTYNFEPFRKATGITYSKHSVIRVEVPDNILEAGNCKDLSETNNLEEIIFSKNSKLEKLNYGCFYANKKLKKVNIPASVKTIETLVINNSTLEELIFDDGFSAPLPKDSFKGALGVKKVVFSNQMTTIADEALNQTLGESLKEFRMGASLTNLGAKNMSYVKQSVKIYMPSQLFSDLDEINMETFSWWASSACLPTGVIFYTGTKAQMQALVDKSVYDRVICKEAELVDWNPEISDDEYVPTNGWRIVCGYNNCTAFYNNVHKFDTDCTSADACANLCGKTNTKNESHAVKETVTYNNGYAQNGIYCVACTNQGCTYGSDTETVLAPIFKALEENGYSTNGNGIAFGGYTVVLDSLKKFNKVNENDITFGIIIANPKYLGDTFMANGEVNATSGFLKVDMTSDEYSDIKVMLDGFTGNAQDLELVITLYAYTEGEDVQYIQSEDTKCANSKVTKADATLYTVTLNSVETKPNIQIAVLPEFGKKENN